MGGHFQVKLGGQFQRFFQGGAAPYGYKWDGKQLAIDEKESPIRKLMYELFAEKKRVRAVSKALNEKGFRTRNGAKFTNTTVERLLRDPAAKGQRRANYTKSTGEKKHWVIKPEDEWVIIPCPAIVSEELWDKCNAILEAGDQARKPRPKPTVHLFSGFVTCMCGNKMYVPSRTTSYTCTKCKRRRIQTSDLEEIYYEHLKEFLLSKGDLKTFETRATEAVKRKEAELESLRKEKDRVKSEMDNLIKLHSQGQIPTHSFKGYFEPLDTQHTQLDESLSTAEGRLDYLRVQALNGSHILDNVEHLYEEWAALDLAVKRRIVEDVTDSITIGDEDISITFEYNPVVLLPIVFLNPPKWSHNNARAGFIITPKKNVFAHPA